MTTTPQDGRVSARVLLRDAAGHLLLLKTLNHPDNPAQGHFWMTPGGGVEPGESLAQAAARELGEEIGLHVSPELLGSPVAFTSGQADLEWASGHFTDHFFQLRVVSHQIDLSGQTDYEQREHLGHRWWPPAELATTTDNVLPWQLGPLLDRLDRLGPPEAPVQLPWHH
ncbi:NUDIX domain-containing protein [Kitasatospora sp. NPDC002227]|uniref:NUDIX hydrolase n=1 Tax=Kitasatospora sp. NPDC002227 TaxID=3154773 RepID=UPI00331855A0